MSAADSPQAPRYRRGAAWTLVVLTPLIAELALGSTPVRMAWLVLLWVPVYGAGVLLIRELAVRRGRGWPSILVLAACYELLEDGLGLQALTSPRLYGAADWGARVLGFNLPYWFANTAYHAVFTVVVPIALTRMLFPSHRDRPYVGRLGLWTAGIVTALGVLVLRVSVPPSEDPGYQAPIGFVIGCLAVVLVLAVVALAVVPPPSPLRTDAAVPGRAALALGAGAATLVFFFLAFPVLGATQPAFTHGTWVLVPLALALAGIVWGSRALTRMSRSAAWTDRDALAPIAGALVAHSLGGMVVMADNAVDRIGLAAITVLTVAGVGLVDRRLRRADRAAPVTPASRRRTRAS
ncbi:hypothetical protein GCM10009853_029120 [Glycomyces scopariae]